MSGIRLKLGSLSFVLLVVLTGVSALSFVLPMADRLTRAMMVLTPLLGIFILLLYLPGALRRRPRITRSALGLLGLLVILSTALLHFGNRAPDIDALRATYVRRLISFDGVRYIWGGENHLGIDCSGLARTAMCEAILRRGIVERNPRLLGPMLWRYWWRDMSARAMLGQTYGYTRPIGHAIQLCEPDTIRMKPGYSLREGDLAVTDSGVHVLIYVGDGEWIEANPDDGRVVANKADGSSRAYFATPVTILRWWMLER